MLLKSSAYAKQKSCYCMYFCIGEDFIIILWQTHRMTCNTFIYKPIFSNRCKKCTHQHDNNSSYKWMHSFYSINKIEYFIERVQLLSLHLLYALHKLLTLLIPYVYVLLSDASLSLLELYDGAP